MIEGKIIRDEKMRKILFTFQLVLPYSETH